LQKGGLRSFWVISLRGYTLNHNSFIRYLKEKGYSDSKVEEILLELYRKIKRKATNPEYEELLAVACSAMGAFYLDLNHERAERFLVEAFNIWSRLQGVDMALPLAGTMNRLGIFYAKNQKFEKAEVMFFDAYTIMKELYKKTGEFELDYALYANNLGIFYFESGMPEEGLKYLFEALKHRDVLPCRGAIPMFNIAMCYEDLGKYREAAEYYIKAASTDPEFVAQEALKKAVEITNPDYVRERLKEMLNKGEISKNVFKVLFKNLENIF